jgi:hypothetical protein
LREWARVPAINADSGRYPVYIIPPMHWILTPDAKPEIWKLVTVGCETDAGDILELEGFWNGRVWRIVGNRNYGTDLSVKMWARKAGSRG